MTRYPRFLLPLVVLILSVTLGASASPLAIVSYFTDNMASTGTSPNVTVMEQALLNTLANATTSIDAAFYDFNRDSIRDALIAAHNRGVAVRVVTDDEARFFIDSYIPYYQALETAGIVVKDDDRSGSIMHNKYFIVDKKTIWTSSTNMSDNGFTLNHNNALFIESADLATIYQNDFDQMWGGNFSTGKSPSPQTALTVSGVPMEVYFSPKDKAMDELIAEVNAAASSIDFAIFFFTDDSLRDALIAAKNRGVQIRGIWDVLGAASPFSEDETLCQAGIPIKIEDTSGKMHHKLMVLDAGTVDGRVFTGSMNWTSAGNNSNDENSLILHSNDLATEYRSAFNVMWNALSPATNCLSETVEVAVYLPLIVRAEPPPPTPTPTGVPTATPTATSTPTPTPTATQPAGASNVVISTIFFDGVVPRVESDEYAEITNNGTAGQNLQGWRLNAGAPGQDFIFPNFVLNPGQVCRVYTNESHPESCGFNFQSGSALWNNSGDCGYLYNQAGHSVSQYCYGNP